MNRSSTSHKPAPETIIDVVPISGEDGELQFVVAAPDIVTPPSIRAFDDDWEEQAWAAFRNYLRRNRTVRITT